MKRASFVFVFIVVCTAADRLWSEELGSSLASGPQIGEHGSMNFAVREQVSDIFAGVAMGEVAQFYSPS